MATESPVALTQWRLKKLSAFRMNTSELHPNSTPQKHRHSSRPVARVRKCLTLMVMTNVEKAQKIPEKKSLKK